jgi:hypothetical protein
LGICSNHNCDYNRTVFKVFDWRDEAYDINEKDKIFCGFISLQSLKEWFNGYCSMLHKKGYCVYVYEVPKTKVVFDKNQIGFYCDNARFVKKLLLSFAVFAVLLWAVVWTLPASWAVMLLLGAAHSADNVVPDLGFWTVVPLVVAMQIATASANVNKS